MQCVFFQHQCTSSRIFMSRISRYCYKYYFSNLYTSAPSRELFVFILFLSLVLGSMFLGVFEYLRIYRIEFLIVKSNYFYQNSLLVLVKSIQMKLFILRLCTFRDISQFQVIICKIKDEMELIVLSQSVSVNTFSIQYRISLNLINQLTQMMTRDMTSWSHLNMGVGVFHKWRR